MGVIRIWHLQREEPQEGVAPLWKVSQKGEMSGHRTRVNDLAVGQNLVWTGMASLLILSHTQ